MQKETLIIATELLLILAALFMAYIYLFTSNASAYGASGTAIPILLAIYCATVRNGLKPR